MVGVVVHSKKMWSEKRQWGVCISGQLKKLSFQALSNSMFITYSRLVVDKCMFSYSIVSVLIPHYLSGKLFENNARKVYLSFLQIYSFSKIHC